ncbi:MAG: hypothetical protein OCC45_13900 [Desulfotalea sp.]
MKIVKILSKDTLEKELIGNVFHVTPIENLKSIKENKGLCPNTKLKYKSLFGNTETGFFRSKGCVSFFDYRDYGSKTWKEHTSKCLPTMILSRTNGIVIFLLSNELFGDLVPWVKWKEEEAFSKRVVPYIEIGHKGFVSMTHITKVISFEPKANLQGNYPAKSIELFTDEGDAVVINRKSEMPCDYGQEQ